MDTRRITNLMDRIERMRLSQTEDVPDDLSKSLWEMGNEFSALDDDGIAALADELDIAIENAQAMVRDYAR